MTSYYVDPALGSGADSGVDWSNAWSSLQRAIDGTGGTQPAAGDVVYLKHTGAAGVADETLSGLIDVDGNSGNTVNGHISYIGVNSSGVEDKTRYVIDGNSAAVNCLKFNAIDYIYFKHLHVKNATGDGIGRASVCNYLGFENILSVDNGADGISCDLFYYSLFVDCGCSNNNVTGFSNLFYAKVIRGVASDNGAYGFQVVTRSVLCNCMSISNNETGVLLTGTSNAIIGGVIDGHDSGGVFGQNAATGNVIISCRITNNSGYGVLNPFLAEAIRVSRCVSFGNTINAFGSGVVDDGTCHGEAGDTSIVTVANRDVVADGYVATDFTLSPTAILRREEVLIGDGTKGSTFVAAGLVPDDLSIPEEEDVREGVEYADGSKTGTFIGKGVGIVGS